MRPNIMRRILLIEDNPGDIQLLQEAMLINNYKHTIKILMDTSDAVNTILHEKPNLIILDINISPINGLDLLKEIRKKGVTIPVIIMTTSSHYEDIFWAYESGANAYVVKPFGLIELTELVKSIILFWEKVLYA